MSKEPLRFLLASDTTGHTAGYYVVSRGLREAGILVISLGYAEPHEIAEAALKEGADIIGYRIMDREPVPLVSALTEAMEELRIGHVTIVVGGIIRRDAIPALREMGVESVFGPGTRIADIVDFLARHKLHRAPRPSL